MKLLIVLLLHALFIIINSELSWKAIINPINNNIQIIFNTPTNRGNLPHLFPCYHIIPINYLKYNYNSLCRWINDELLLIEQINLKNDNKFLVVNDKIKIKNNVEIKEKCEEEVVKVVKLSQNSICNNLMIINNNIVNNIITDDIGSSSSSSS